MVSGCEVFHVKWQHKGDSAYHTLHVFFALFNPIALRKAKIVFLSAIVLMEN